MKPLYEFDKQQLLYRSSFEPYKLRAVITLLLCCLLFTSFRLMEPKTIEYIITETTLKEIDRQQHVFDLIDSYPFKYPGIIKAQAVLETGNFKSPVCIEGNNYFGIRLPRARITTAKGEHLKHALYESMEESVLDRFIYEVRYLSKFSKQEYLNYLDRVYAEGDNYSKKLLQIEKNLK